MKITGAQILIQELINHGIDEVFGYPGGTVLNIYDELYKNSDKIKHYITAHEQGASHAADGYARATGKVGVVIATSGPGATNLVTGLATAFLDSVPLIAITGNVATNLIGRDSFQEVDIVGVTMPITKHNYIVKNVNELQEVINEAFKIAKSGRPGPVLIDIPKNVQQDLCEYKKLYQPEDEVRKVNKVSINDAIKMLEEAKKPFIYAGGGVVSSEATNELLAFADKIDAPIGSSLMGLSACPCEIDKCLGMVGMHGRYASSKALAECDLLISVGSRFSDRATGNKKMFIKNCKVLQIDIDNAEIDKNIPTNSHILGDIKQILNILNSKLSQQNNDEWLKHVVEMKNSEKNNLETSINEFCPKAIINKISSIMPAETAVATDVGQHQMWTAQHYNFKKTRKFITSGGLGTMGFGLGACIGACIANNKQKTVLFTSDGSFHMNLNELATAVSNNLPILIVMLDNNALGMVRQWQTIFFDKRYAETSLNRKTDYVKLAEAFGANGAKATNMEELEKALEKSEKCDGPFLVHCIIDHNENVFPMIPPNGTINDIIMR